MSEIRLTHLSTGKPVIIHPENYRGCRPMNDGNGSIVSVAGSTSGVFVQESSDVVDSRAKDAIAQGEAK